MKNLDKEVVYHRTWTKTGPILNNPPALGEEFYFKLPFTMPDYARFKFKVQYANSTIPRMTTIAASAATIDVMKPQMLLTQSPLMASNMLATLNYGSNRMADDDYWHGNKIPRFSTSYDSLTFSDLAEDQTIDSFLKLLQKAVDASPSATLTLHEGGTSVTVTFKDDDIHNYDAFGDPPS